jgi:hypothetical protein
VVSAQLPGLMGRPPLPSANPRGAVVLPRPPRLYSLAEQRQQRAGRVAAGSRRRTAAAAAARHADHDGDGGGGETLPALAAQLSHERGKAAVGITAGEGGALDPTARPSWGYNGGGGGGGGSEQRSAKRLSATEVSRRLGELDAGRRRRGRWDSASSASSSGRSSVSSYGSGSDYASARDRWFRDSASLYDQSSPRQFNAAAEDRAQHYRHPSRWDGSNTRSTRQKSGGPVGAMGERQDSVLTAARREAAWMLSGASPLADAAAPHSDRTHDRRRRRSRQGRASSQAALDMSPPATTRRRQHRKPMPPAQRAAAAAPPRRTPRRRQAGASAGNTAVRSPGSTDRGRRKKGSRKVDQDAAAATAARLSGSGVVAHVPSYARLAAQRARQAAEARGAAGWAEEQLAAPLPQLHGPAAAAPLLQHGAAGLLSERARGRIGPPGARAGYYAAQRTLVFAMRDGALEPGWLQGRARIAADEAGTQPEAAGAMGNLLMQPVQFLTELPGQPTEVAFMQVQPEPPAWRSLRAEAARIGWQVCMKSDDDTVRETVPEGYSAASWAARGHHAALWRAEQAALQWEADALSQLGPAEQPQPSAAPAPPEMAGTMAGTQQPEPQPEPAEPELLQTDYGMSTAPRLPSPQAGGGAAESGHSRDDAAPRLRRSDSPASAVTTRSAEAQAEAQADADADADAGAGADAQSAGRSSWAEDGEVPLMAGCGEDEGVAVGAQDTGRHAADVEHSTVEEETVLMEGEVEEEDDTVLWLAASKAVARDAEGGAEQAAEQAAEAAHHAAPAALDKFREVVAARNRLSRGAALAEVVVGASQAAGLSCAAWLGGARAGAMALAQRLCELEEEEKMEERTGRAGTSAAAAAAETQDGDEEDEAAFTTAVG